MSKEQEIDGKAMRLRKLELKDKKLMLEWMHDINVTRNLRSDFQNMTLDDCEKFITNNIRYETDIHRAIVDDNDRYIGTVSLKNIHDKTAEFAIVIRPEGMGKGYSKYAMTRMLSYGFTELNLSKIYWYVSKNNVRAIRFYEKNNFTRTEIDEEVYLKLNVKYDFSEIKNYYWYICER